MTTEELALLVIEACEAEEVAHMLTGALATNFYGVPRSTKDVDMVIDVSGGDPLGRVARRLGKQMDFADQVEFDTLTWGQRLVGTSRTGSPLKVELFALFDDAFVTTQFERRVKVPMGDPPHAAWLPTPEDLVVQKIRWGRAKDLDDARAVLAVQGLENLDLKYVTRWCEEHGTLERLERALGEIRRLEG